MDYYYFMYIAKTKLNMSDDEFWNSTIYKINKLYEFYLKERGGLIEKRANKVMNDEKTISKWGRPVTHSTEF